MERGASVLSAHSTRWILLRAPFDPLSLPEASIAGAHTLAGTQLIDAANYSFGILEAFSHGRPHAEYSFAAGRDRRATLHAAFLHQPAASSMVPAIQKRRDPLPAIRAFQFRIDA